jgi:hypothetical protein
VGRSRLDLEFRRRRDGSTDYRVTRREGPVRVVRQPVPDGRDATPAKRLLAAASSLRRL